MNGKGLGNSRIRKCLAAQPQIVNSSFVEFAGMNFFEFFLGRSNCRGLCVTDLLGYKGGGMRLCFLPL